MSRIVFIRTIFYQFIKFGIVGISNTLIGYLVYSSLVLLQFHYILANFFSFIIGITNSFYWNNKYVFKQGADRSKVKSFIKMGAAYGFTGILLQTVFLYIFIDKLYISRFIAPVLCLFISVPANFLLNKLWVFKDEVCAQDEKN